MGAARARHLGLHRHGAGTVKKRKFQFYRNEDGVLMVTIEPRQSVNIVLARRLGCITQAEAEAAEKLVPRDVQ